MSAWLRRSRSLSTLAMSFPVVVWVTDCVYSIYTVRGSSMEPSLKEGDMVLVRKADMLPAFIVNSSKSTTELPTRAQIQRIEGDKRAPIFARPPMALPGDVVVFCSPQTAFPNEYHIKRVMAASGQMIRPGNRFRHIQHIPPYNLWVEGDNVDNSEDSGSYGPISKKLLIGQAERIVWPPSRWRRVEKVIPPQGTAWWV